ncbi:MAG: DUF1850 domain-containing protein [Desulfovibrio sp.]|nr:DUF1850 domain-containing protein [Desulfovibrio sp.]
MGEVRAGETPKEIAVDAKGCVARVSDARTGKLYAEAPAHVGSRLFFGWIHSLEKIPWNEYYHVDEQRNLVLDTITFPAFGAGIPADKGRVCRVRDGLIHMEEIEQIFPELVWLNSQTATRDIVLDGKLLVRGADMPHHARVRLIVLPDVDQAKEGTK